MNHKILALLRENARMGIQEIALRSGLPEAEAEQEIRELEKSGVIRGYTAILNESELDDNKVKAGDSAARRRLRPGGATDCPFPGSDRPLSGLRELRFAAHGGGRFAPGGGLVRLGETLHHRRGPFDLHELFAEEIQGIRQDHAE